MIFLKKLPKQTPKAEFCFKVSNRKNHIVNKRYFKEWYAFSMPSALKKLLSWYGNSSLNIKFKYTIVQNYQRGACTYLFTIL